VESFQVNDEVLAIFSGAHSYISSSWYDHENVPTWNYLAVHVYGKLTIYNHEQAVDSLKRLVDKYEAKSKNPIRIEDLSSKTMREARGIIAFEIEITAIEAQKKLSQNRDDKNYKNIISELEKTNDNQAIAIANEMKKNR
jgi:transcriptional regulator